MTDHADIGKDGRRYPLTAKQEALAQASLEHDTKSDAYRDAYDTENMTGKQINEEACVAFAIPKVARRVKELQEAAMERHETTVDSITTKLSAAYKVAHKNEQPAAMTGAALGEAKLHGLLIEKREVTVTTADLPDDEIDARRELIRQELAELGTRH